MESEFDQILFFEHAGKTAEAAYAKNPIDADNMTRWGVPLLELSQFQITGFEEDDSRGVYFHPTRLNLGRDLWMQLNLV